MKNNFNWAGTLCLGAYFFTLMILFSDQQSDAGMYAIAAVVLALLAVPFAIRSTIKETSVSSKTS